MCLAVPGKVLRWLNRTTPFENASIEFAGVSREISMACVPEAEIGDYVLVHAGIALSIISRAEAQRLLQTFAELELDSESEETPP